MTPATTLYAVAILALAYLTGRIILRAIRFIAEIAFADITTFAPTLPNSRHDAQQGATQRQSEGGGGFEHVHRNKTEVEL